MLSMQHVSFRYSPDQPHIFTDLSHDFTPGAMTAITGVSGQGKSTLLYILGLMLTPSRGHIALGEHHVSSASDAERSLIRAQRLGFVFQDSALDPTRPILDSVIEPALYAGWSLQSAREQATALLDELGLGHRVKHKPAEISGGQAQRVAVCRALVNGPEVVLADEPTGNLDRDNARIVIDALRTLGSTTRRTVVIATHDPFVLEQVDEVFSL